MRKLRDPNGTAVCYFVVTWLSGHKTHEGPYQMQRAYAVANQFREAGMTVELWREPDPLTGTQMSVYGLDHEQTAEAQR
jgi:hypothetical protein